MIETKEISLFGSQSGDKYMREQYEKCHGYINDLTAFGWQPTQTASRRSGRSSHSVQIMARETSMPHYNEYRRLEEDYETAKGNIKYYGDNRNLFSSFVSGCHLVRWFINLH